jgi:transposase InsO family protein
MSRQNHYKQIKARTRREIDEELIVQLVKKERMLQSEIGARKLRIILAPILADAGVTIGRDRFFEVMRGADLLIRRRRRRAPRTTDSQHAFRTYTNLFKSLEITGPHQAWVCDLTYVRTDEAFVYLSLITDAWSRKVVGWHVGDNLEAIGCMQALKRAIRQLPVNCHVVHHSDRGSQYCCLAYVEMLRARGLTISMTEDNHCYENAMAERLNGILKQEYGLSATFRNTKHALQAVKQAVHQYNIRRPHTALAYQTPEQVHAGLGTTVTLKKSQT